MSSNEDHDMLSEEERKQREKEEREREKMHCAALTLLDHKGCSEGCTLREADNALIGAF